MARKKTTQKAPNKNLAQQIKEMEQAKRKKEAPKVEPVGPQKVSFNDWYARRKGQIPSHHRKEVILADFKARKLQEFETMEKFDAALKLYGIKL